MSEIEIRCHDNDPRHRDLPIVWDAAYVPEPEPPIYSFCGGRHYGPFRAYRNCSYCGCIHPEDLRDALRAGARMHGSDWKYGWPHKFYVDDIPNPYPDLPIVTSHGPGDGPAGSRGWACGEPHPAGPTQHGKWYNKHLIDLKDTDLFTELRALIRAHTAILFDFDEAGELVYRAPSYGYQR